MITRMATNVIGLDIGGANLKAALASGEARSHVFQLWKSPRQLAEALRDLVKGWSPSRLAVSMTGELCDCFDSKKDGVFRILSEVERAFPAIPIRIWSTAGKFVEPAEAKHNSLDVAAANWHALATLTGRTLAREGPALMIDVGSTTTDIIPLWNGSPIPLGRTDFARLRSRELIYTGVKRTPVCALIQDGLMAELFATSHDAYLLLGHIAPDPSDYHTADGRSAVAICAHGRMARMLGGDPQITPQAETQELAKRVYARQRALIADAIKTVAARLPAPPQTVVFFGSGEFLGRSAWLDCAAELGPGADSVRTISLAETLSVPVSTAACAYAVAVLAEE